MEKSNVTTLPNAKVKKEKIIFKIHYLQEK